MTLKKWLKSKSMKPTQFARAHGFSPSTILRLVQGITDPSRPTMRRIKEATGGKVKPADFYT